MIDRRTALAAGVMGGVLAGGAMAQTAPQRRRLALAPVRNGKSALTPDQALALLIEGNRAMVADELAPPDISAQRRLDLAKSQSPFVAYISCSDSRVPPELLFGRGLGEFFIIRNAGNTVDTVALGSLEFAVAKLGVPLVVVMGHESCGAVEAAISVVENNTRFPGAIDNMIEPIIPAVLQARGRPGDKVTNAVKANVSRTVGVLRQESDALLMGPQAAGKLKIVGAYYELASGRVDFFDRP